MSDAEFVVAWQTAKRPEELLGPLPAGWSRRTALCRLYQRASNLRKRGVPLKTFPRGGPGMRTAGEVQQLAELARSVRP